MLQAIPHKGAVWQFGQSIVQGLVFEFLDVALLLTDVLDVWEYYDSRDGGG